ncbi:MAG: hypothetical protein O2968_23435 [Acidobacteria bacterium]|nr:hypothetical protein [Acidobacteriota bacterium]
MPSRDTPKKLIQSAVAARDRHRQRNRPTGFRFALSDSIRFVRDGDWDRVAAGCSLFLGRGYLGVLEASLPDNLRLRYAMIYDDAEPVAICVMQIVNVTASSFAAASEGDSGFQRADRLRLRQLRKIKAQLLVCGNLFSWGSHGVAFASGRDPAEIWPAVTEALYRVRRAEKLEGQAGFVLIKDLQEETWRGFEAIETFGYRPLETEPNMVLTLGPTCKTFDDYLSQLNARYRKSARGLFRKVEQAGCVVERLTDLAAHKSRLHQL